MRKKITLARYGPARRSVRVFVDPLQPVPMVRVQWREHGRLRTQSWPDGRDNRTAAKAWAKGFAETRDQVKPAGAPLTIRALWDAFLEDQTHLRPRTVALYTEYWRRWEYFAGKGFHAESVTRKMIVEFRRDLQKRLHLAISTVRDCFKVVKRVYAWGEETELLDLNRWRAYRFTVGKDQRPTPPAEFRQEEFLKVLAAFRPELASQWRPFVALSICGYQGARQNAVLHLSWDDIDLEQRTVVWRARWDKLGKEWVQPLRRATIEALEVARHHRERERYDGPWVFFPASRKSRLEVYSGQSLWQALKEAEKRAGIEHRERRGAHGMRRLLAGNIASVTGNAMMGLRAIGDKDPRMLDRYVQRRDDELAAAFEELDRHENVTGTGARSEPAAESTATT